MIRRALCVAVSLCLLLVAFERQAIAQDPSSSSSLDQLLDAGIDESDSEYDTPPPPTIRDMLGVPSPSPSNASAPAIAHPSFTPNTTLAMILLGVGGFIYLFLELVAEVQV
jgi:hypothetical protein